MQVVQVGVLLLICGCCVGEGGVRWWISCDGLLDRAMCVLRI